MKKFFSALAVMLMLAVFSGCNESVSISVFHTWTTYGMQSHVMEADRWEVHVASVNGRAWRDINFSAENLGAIRVKSTNNYGEARLTLIQGYTRMTIDLTEEFYGLLDTGDFEPGEIRLQLDFINAESVSISINW